MRNVLVENIQRLHLLSYLAFNEESSEAQAMPEKERKMRIFLSRHCLDHWDLESALRSIRDCFEDTVEIKGPVRRKLKKKRSTRIPFDHCDDVLEALRYLYMLDEDDKRSVKKEFENKFLWNFFIVPIIEIIRSLNMCDVNRPEIMMVAVTAVLDDVRLIIQQDETEGTFDDAIVAHGVMMARMK